MIESSTISILHNGHPLGTGFLIARDVAVTCAHVVESAGETLHVRFTGREEILPAEVLREYQRDPDHGDIAFLRLGNVPAGCRPLSMGAAEHSSSGNSFQAFGYPTLSAVEGVHARGEILGMVTENGQRLLQLRSMELNQGHSGSPVWDEQRGIVVGMVVSVYKSEASGKLRDTAFAVPSETLWQVYPAIGPSETAPYRGLETFTEETADFFFGRQGLTKKLLKVLRAGNRFLAVFGPSGSGKSSVVRAGLLPALKEGQVPGSKKWAQIIMRPADDPFEQLKAAGLEALDVHGYLQSYAKVERVVLLIDQFEELFTLCPDDLRGRFVRDLVAALESSRLILIMCMRDDFYSVFNAQAAPLAESEHLKIENVPGILQQEELIEMIEQPAMKVGLALEKGLTESIIKDLTREGEARSSTLPLLEFALTQLWEKRRDGRLTHEAYQEIGGVTGSLAGWADDAYSELPQAEQVLAESLLISLVHLGDESQGLPDTRGRRTLKELRISDSAQKVINHFANRRLISTSGETVEFIHDALVREWSRLVGWLRENRRFLLWRQRVAEKFEEWKKGTGELLRGRELAEAQEFLKEHESKLKELGGYIRLSASRQRRQRNILIGIVSIAFVIFGVLAFWGQTNAISAQSQARTSRANEMAVQAISLRDTQLSLSLLLAVEASKLEDNVRTRTALLDNMSTHPEVLKSLVQHSSPVKGVAFSPNGKILASASCHNYIEVEAICEEGELIFWDMTTHLPITQPVPAHAGWIYTIAFNPEPATNMLATGSSDGTILLWDAETHRPTGQPLSRHSAAVTSLAFNPDGNRLASGDTNGLLILWDLETRQPLLQLQYGELVASVAFNPDGKTLALSSCTNYDDSQHLKCENNEITLLDTQTGEPIGETMVGHMDLIRGLAFSPNGTILASGSDDNTIILWDTKIQQQRGDPFIVHIDWVYSVVFIDDITLASGSTDGTIILWDLEAKTQIEKFTGHSDWINSLAINSDGNILASASEDHIVMLWKIGNAKPFGQPSKGHQNIIFSIAFSPDGQTLASGSVDGTIILWDKNVQQQVASLNIGSPVLKVAFSWDGKILAVGKIDGAIELWDVENHQRIGEPLRGHSEVVSSLAFSPDGEMLASKSDDNIVILWDMKTYQPLGEPLTEGADYLSNVVFSPQNTYLAFGENNNLILWDIAAQKRIDPPLTGHPDAIGGVAVSPDGKVIASGSYARIILWDVSTRTQIGTALSSPKGNTGTIESLAFSPDGKTLASNGCGSFSPEGLCTEPQIFIWDVTSGQFIGELYTEKQIWQQIWPSILTFSTDGKILASAGCGDLIPEKGCTQGQILLWDMDPASWIDKSCQRAGRNFIRAEWIPYFPNEEYRKTCQEWPLEPEPAGTK